MWYRKLGKFIKLLHFHVIQVILTNNKKISHTTSIIVTYVLKALVFFNGINPAYISKHTRISSLFSFN